LIKSPKVRQTASNNHEESIGNGGEVRRTAHFNVINARSYTVTNRVHGFGVQGIYRRYKYMVILLYGIQQP